MIGGSMSDTIMGKMELTIYENNNYKVINSFDNNIEELVFLLFMVDKVLADIEDPKYVTNISSLIGSYIINLEGGRDKLAKFFNIYNLVMDDSSAVVFKVNQKLLSKQRSEGEHLFIWTDPYSMNPDDFDVNLGISALLYTKNFIDRLDFDEQSVCADVYGSMLQIYLDTKFPDTPDITKAPSLVVNRLIDLNNN
jgi:hypothetical protein